MKKIEEVWIPIKGHEDRYEVSNLGNIKSLNYGNTKIERLLNPKYDKDGYLEVNLCGNGTSLYRRVHRLVAMAFIPNLDNKPQVNHINGVKDDNRVENLEWCTNQENCRHAYRTGLSFRSELNTRRIVEAKQKIAGWFNRITLKTFIGNSYELMRAFPEEKLNSSSLSKLRRGIYKQHKNWTITNARINEGENVL